MRVNVDKVLERDQKLSELDDRADALQAGASQFESSAAKLKNKYWWKNCKVGMSAILLLCVKVENDTTKCETSIVVRHYKVKCYTCFIFREFRETMQ